MGIIALKMMPIVLGFKMSVSIDTIMKKALNDSNRGNKEIYRSFHFLGGNMSQNKTIVLSGVRATGRMHLGNYIGALQHQVSLSEDPNNQCYYFVADLHTITTGFKPEELSNNREQLALDFLGAGLDPEKACLYCQTSVPEISELSWLLSCLVGYNKLEGMSHWEEKKKRLTEEKQLVTAGLFTYPVLMAADILGVKGEIIPVGDDQRQHVEFAREIARAFNKRFGMTFPEPDDKVFGVGRVPSLQANGKMGKSEAESGTIYLTEPVADARKKVLTAQTDTKRVYRSDIGNPADCNIYTLHTILSTAEEIQWVYGGCTTAGIGCRECKEKVFTNIAPILERIQERRATFEARGPKFIRELLHENGKKARAVFGKTLAEVRDKMGIPSY